MRRRHPIRACLALVPCLALLSAPALAATPGSLNPGFGKGGVTRIDAGAVGVGRWPDLVMVEGRPVVLAESRDGHSALFFLRHNGSLDASVGDGGMVDFANGEWRGLAAQPDGRIILAGSVGQVPAVMRIDADGEPDPTFSGDGIAEVPVEGDSNGRPRAADDYFGQVLVRGDGTILALRNPLECGEEWCTPSRGAVVALRPDGTHDDTFGAGGTAWLPVPPAGPPPESVYRVGTMSLRRDDGVLIGGTTGGKLSVFGLTASGAVDPSWGGDGVVLSNLEYEEGEEGWGGIATSYGEARSILVRNDGRVIVVADAALLALRTDGTVEREFGRHGVVRTESAGRERIEFGDAMLDDAGRPVLGGEWRERSTVVRLTPSGAFNRAFSRDGIVALDLSRRSAPRRVNEAVTSVALGDFGETLTAGFTFRNGRFEPTLTRLRQ